MWSKSVSKVLITKKHLKKVIWIQTFKEKIGFFAKSISDDINTSIHSSKFHVELKEADIASVHKKKKSKLSKENYRSVRIPVYERCL